MFLVVRHNLPNGYSDMKPQIDQERDYVDEWSWGPWM